jgi:hypothetical protein
MDKNKLFEKKIMTKKEDPCWDDYHMVGMKDKDGREVPNCVPDNPKESTMKITSKDILEALINKTISFQEARLLVEEYGQKDGMCPDCGCKLETDGHCAMCDKQY